jgi:hypothetical protein
MFQSDEDENDNVIDSDDDSDDLDFESFQRSRVRSNFVNTSNKSNVDSVPLLDDDSTSDDESLTIADRNSTTPALSRIDGHRNGRQVDDSFYLSDQRRWTGVRDAHLEMRSFNED